MHEKARALLAVRIEAAQGGEKEEATQEKEQELKKKDIVHENICKIGDILTHMVAESGVKKATGVSRRESAALAHGVGLGIGLGHMLTNDDAMGDHVLSDERAMFIASHFMNESLQEYAKDRDRLLSLSRDTENVRVVDIETEGR